ncbi:MAG: hypothetical protein JWM14_232 [Chitinophagaceae bacterium]|nr:hypothetical protein [Chitinophagaceae bacterium]
MILISFACLAIIFIAIHVFNYLKLLEVNTVDPQASFSIESSKATHLFISEYTEEFSSEEHKYFERIWIEHAWKNKIVERKVVKEILDGYQLVARVSKANNVYLKDSLYFINWELKFDDNTSFGKGNGVYSVFLQKKELPEKIKVILIKNISSRTEDIILLKRKT